MPEYDASEPPRRRRGRPPHPRPGPRPPTYPIYGQTERRFVQCPCCATIHPLASYIDGLDREESPPARVQLLGGDCAMSWRDEPLTPEEREVLVRAALHAVERMSR